jgi:branched-chain amino acid transport system permease protein
LLNPWVRRAVAVVAGLVLVAAPFYLSPGDEYIAGLAVIAILLALSYNLLLGSTGMVSFGHAAFYGVGAFTVALIPPACMAMLSSGWRWHR